MGAGAVSRAGDEASRLGAGRVLVVTDQGILKAGLLEKVEMALRSFRIKSLVFDGVEPDPPYELVEKCLEAAAGRKIHCVLGLGGGSALDIAKAASVMATNKGKISDYFGIELIPKAGLPLILVPTTAGTGSEVTPITILSDEQEKLKKGVVSSYLIPSVAILDPELTLGLPPHVTAATGMDALIHAIEAYTSLNANSMTDLLACRAMELLYHNIRTAFAQGGNLEARARDAGRKPSCRHGLRQCRGHGRPCLCLSHRRRVPHSTRYRQLPNVGPGNGVQHAGKSGTVRPYGPYL